MEEVTRSLYGGELLSRGFDLWGDEATTEELETRMSASIGPAFLHITLLTIVITFAFDEHGDIWAAEGIVDLSDMGFQQVDFASTCETLN